MKSIRDACKPRPEVRKGDLQDTVFAANFGHVIAGNAPDVYQKPKVFFDNTHPAQQLKKVCTAIFERLAQPREAGAAVRLSTGFGGGKTHTLVALWHLANNVANTSLGTDLVRAAGRPKKVAVAAVDGSGAGSRVFLTHGSLKVRSLWGEIAWQLGGAEGYRRLKADDDPETVPDITTFRKVLPSGPVLILLDELVVYMAGLSERGKGALKSFVRKLLDETKTRPQLVVVITDPAGELAYEQESEELKRAAEAAARDLDALLGRQVTDYDPIGGEAAQVIAKRLFERIDADAAQEVSAQYYAAYDRVAQDYPDFLSREAATREYAERIVLCYPFYPRLMDTAQHRLGALRAFQRSRGTLRLFARILRDIWDSHSDLPLVTAGDINWSSPRIQADLLSRLNHDRFAAAVGADIEGHAAQLDAEHSTDVHRRVASALLLESLPMTSASALDHREATLAVLRPSEAGNEPAEALDRLVAVCWHTFPTASGTAWQFRYEPNINKIIEERSQDVPLEDARAGVRTLAQNYCGGQVFSLVSWPDSAKQVPDRPSLQLALCETAELAQALCQYADDSHPEAPVPRQFRNAILAIAAEPDALAEAVRLTRRRLAAEELRQDLSKQSGKDDRDKAVSEQLEKTLSDLRRRASIQTARAFTQAFLPGRSALPLEEKYLVPADAPVGRPEGQKNLKQFLDDKKLIYQPGDALDTDLFMDKVMPGVTPNVDLPGTYTTKAVYERALSVQGLRLMRDSDVIRRSIIRAVEAGRLVLCKADGSAYDKDGAVVGPQGQRRRTEDRLTTFPVDDTVLVAMPDASCVAEWLKVDEEKEDKRKKRGEIIREPEPRPVAHDWATAIRLAETRHLLSLGLKATDPEAAKSLLTLAQPFGAKQLNLSVNVGGDLKGGGTLNFAANNLSVSHALKPLEVAERFHRALQEGGSYEANLCLDFGEEGRAGLSDRLEQASQDAPEAIQIFARFGEEK